MEAERLDYRRFTRILPAAERERLALRRSLPADMRIAIADITIRFEPRPAPAQLAQGVKPEAVTTTDRPTQTLNANPLFAIETRRSSKRVG